MEFLRNQTASPSYVFADDANIILVDEKDLLILWDGSKAGEIVKAKNGALSSTMGKIHLESHLFDLNFLTYYLKNAEPYIQANTVGMGIPHVSGEVLRTLFITFPKLLEQTKIAQYLDHQTAIIDQLIQQKVKLIELLKEKRQAVINEAVTKGLNPNAKMKDSGIEWLGEVPEEWEIIKLKHCSSIKNSTIDRHEFEDEIKVNICHYPFAYKNEFIDNSIELATGTCSLSEYENFSLKRGQIIITKDSETANDIGVPAYIKENIDNGVCGYHLTMIDVFSKGLISEFLFRYVQSSFVAKYFELNSNGVTRYGLGKAKIENLPILVPSLKEQRKIINKLNGLSELQTNLKCDLILQIEKLKEYRQAIISEAVTGKIDVRDWVPNKQQVT